MLSVFRNFFKSKVGIVVTLAFLGIIAFAFASADVSNTGTFGGVAGGNRVAVVGGEKISSADLARAANSSLDNVRQDNPTISMPVFLQQGGLGQVLDQMIDRSAIGGFAEKYGLRAGANLVNSEIIAIPAFRGANGNFDENAYRQAIAARGLSDSLVRQDLGDGLLAKQILVPASFGAVMPDKFVSRYASLLKEQRKGSIGIVPSAAFAPKTAPTEKQVQDFYAASRGDYIRPERRVIRFASFGADSISGSLEPTAREISASYEANREKYAARETRGFSQLIVPTQQAANAIRSRVQSGGSLEAAAREAGLAVAAIGPFDRQQLSGQASAAVAQAAFAAARGTVAAPARSGLGWHVIRVDSVDKTAGRNLDQARSEILTTLREEKRRTALADLSASIEERLEEGESLVDVAKELGIELQTTRPITGNGLVYGSQNETAPEILGPVLQTAFQMEEGEPQLAEVARGETFMIFEASDITPSAAAPLKEIRQQVVAGWRLAEGSKAARAAADRILKRMQAGSTIAQATAAEKIKLPPVDPINLSREQLAATGQVPPPLALLFSMAEGTAKKLEAPRNGGWFIVDLNDIVAGTISKDDPIFRQAKRDLGITTGREYAEQLRIAMREEMGVERNQPAIEAVRKQLSGEN